MSQQTSGEENLNSGIDQRAENSTLGGEMQAIQGDNNTQQQNNLNQEIFKNLQVSGDLTVSNITHINQTTNNTPKATEKSFCAVILTAIAVEYNAVRRHLTDLKEETHSQGTIYERGKFTGNGKTWEVGIVEVGAGNTTAAVEAERAIAYFKPEVIFFVGVAGGIKDVVLGDVVAGTKVYGYESGKTKQEFEPRPDVGVSTYNLIQRARAEARKTDWLERLKVKVNKTPKVFVAPIAAGEKVVASRESSVLQFLKLNYGDAIAVEMEGRGILQAAYANQQVSALIVRGISDLIDGKSKADAGGSQEIAACHASAFAFEVLAKFDVNGVTKELWAEQGHDFNLVRKEEEGVKTSIWQNLKAFIVNLWWSLNPQFKWDYCQSLIDYFREFKIEGFRIGLPVVDLEDVYVALRVDTRIPEKISGAIVGENNNFVSQEIWDFLRQSSKKKFQVYRRLAVIGSPGSGKTTLLRHLTLIYGKELYRKYKTPSFIPVLLYLRNVRDLITTEKPLSLVELIEDHIKKLPAPQRLTAPPNWVENRLKMGKLLVMLDGLDEVADESQRQKVSKWVNQQMKTYRQTNFIVTSRPYGFRSTPVEEVGTVLEVLPFSQKQMEEFIHNWYLQTEIMSRAGRNTPAVRDEAKNHAENLIERIISNRSIADMARNPLLVTMISTVHYCGSALPGRRVELYQKICDLLLGSRQEAKGIKTPLTGEQYKLVLQVLALALMERKTREFTPKLGEELIKDKLRKVTGDKLTPSEFLEQIKKLCGLLVERELGVYEFAHLSFQEYLAAVQIKELQEDNILVDNLDDLWWAEAIRLYAAQGNASNLIEKAIENSSVNSLSLALDCLEASLEVEPEVRENLELMLEEGLESSDDKIAKLAAEVKLSRRLKNLREINENLEIDVSYISCVEYQLFVNEKLNSESCFSRGSGKRAITEVSWENALKFCNWLSSKTKFIEESSDGVYFYRLPTVSEAKDNLGSEYLELGCWTFEGSSQEKNGIRVVRAKVVSEYTKLVNYFVDGEVEKARKETRSILLKFANREREGELDISSVERIPCSCVSTIDNLWMQWSEGYFRWGVNKNGKSSEKSNDISYVWWLNTSGNVREVFNALVEKHIGCGIKRSSPLFVFDVVSVNKKGEEVQWECGQGRCFSEDLENGITLDMVGIPGGKFMMGSPEGEGRDSERPQHEVTVSSFYMGKFQVTQAQWEAVAKLPQVKTELKPKPSNFKGDNRPVEQVSWNDAVEFCARLSKHTGREYRLPSEAEWEYACRAGSTTPFHFGETITGNLANYHASSVYANEPKGKYREETTPVGQFPANAFGLYDMHGNVWEWCLDDWHSNYEKAPTYGSAWTKNENDNRSQSKVLRGGSWDVNPECCRSACRTFNDVPEFLLNAIGFRVVCAMAQRILQ